MNKVKTEIDWICGVNGWQNILKTAWNIDEKKLMTSKKRKEKIGLISEAGTGNTA